MLIAFAWGWWRQGKSFTLSAPYGLGMSSSNSRFIGYPIAAQVGGPARRWRWRCAWSLKTY
jgi:hypothetical protein